MQKRTGLIVSVLLNAGLAGAVAFLIVKSTEPEPGAGDARPMPKFAAKSRGDVVYLNSPETQAPSSFHWSTVESADYHAYIANLRSIGVPEETIRDIIIADVNKLFAARRTALVAPPKEYRFWEAEDRYFSGENRDQQRQLRELDKEKNALIKELLGIDLQREQYKYTGGTDYHDRQYGFLSLEKQDQIKTLLDRYRELEQDIYDQADGDLTSEHRARINAMRQQREVEIAQLLTPEELLEYQLRNSSTARSMRYNLAGFEPSEAEFLAIFRLRKEYDDKYSNLSTTEAKAVEQQRKLDQQRLEEQYKALLGEQRYAEYRRAQDGNYQEVYRVARRYGLEKAAADTVYEMKRLAEAQRRTVERDPNIPPDQKKAVLKALAAETEQSVSAAMGEKAYSYYKRRGGSWIDRLGR